MQNQIKHNNNKVGQFFSTIAEISQSEIRDTHISGDFQNLIIMGSNAVESGLAKEYQNIDEVLIEEHQTQLASKTALEAATMLLRLDGVAKITLDQDELELFTALTNGMTSLLCQLTRHHKELSKLTSCFNNPRPSTYRSEKTDFVGVV